MSSGGALIDRKITDPVNFSPDLNSNYLQVVLQKCVKLLQKCVPVGFTKTLSAKFCNIFLRNFAELCKIIVTKF
jgi:hypothetical protein